MRTSEVIKQFGLDPALEWKRGWKVAIKERKRHRSFFTSNRVWYREGSATQQPAGCGPLTGFRYKRDAQRFMRNNPTSFNIELKPMLYIEYTGRFYVVGAGSSREVFAVWYPSGLTMRKGIIGRKVEYMPRGTIYAEVIVIH